VSPGIAFEFEGDLLEIVLCCPERRNALGDAEWSRLETAIRKAANSPKCEFVSIRAEGNFFCSGIDLALIKTADQTAGGLVSLIERNGEILSALEKLPQFVIVALNGPAVGIGVHLALCGDLILARRSVSFWMPEAKLGIPDVLHYQLIEQSMGRSAAVSMMALGARISAEEATNSGLVGRCYDDEAALASGARDCLDRLRAVPKPVRLAMKRYMSAKGRSSDPQGQAEAIKFVLGSRNYTSGIRH